MNAADLIRLEELLLAFLVEHAGPEVGDDISHVLAAVRRRRRYLTRK
jgi:hypothetical protein